MEIEVTQHQPALPLLVEDRLERVERVLRAYSMHEPECPSYRRYLEIQGAIAAGSDPGYAPPAPCACWVG